MKKPDYISAEILATIGAWTLHNAQGKPEIASAIFKNLLPQFQNRYPHEKLLTHWCEDAKEPARVVPDVEKVQIYTVARRLSARLPSGEVLSVAPDDWQALADDLHAHGAAADDIIFGNDEDDGKERAVSGSVTVPLAKATSDTLVITGAAMAGLAAIYREGYPFARAGVMLSELIEQDSVPVDLFDEPASDQKAVARMAVMDTLNARFGRGTLKSASAANGAWQMRQSRKSPSYTTQWSDLIHVRG